MSDVIKLVQSDTLPTVYVSLIDQTTELPVDISTATQVRVDFRAIGATVLTDTLYGTKIAGTVSPDGSINVVGYPVAGSGGRFSFNWNTNSLAAIGSYEGAIVITYAGGGVQTVYTTLRFTIRQAF